MDSRARLVTLGDSHSVFSYAGVADAILLWRGPVTMHRAARDGLRALLPSLLYYVPRRRDTLVLSFGEIDCREHILRVSRRNGTSPEYEVDALCARFQHAVEAFRGQFRGRVAISCVPPHLDGVRPSGYVETDPAYDALQVAIRRRMNDRLRGFGLPFVDFTAAFETEAGSMASALSDGVCHIAPARSEPVVAALRAIGVAVSFAPPPDDVFHRVVTHHRGAWLRRVRRHLSPLRLITRPLRRRLKAMVRRAPVVSS